MVSVFYFSNGATTDSISSLITVLETLDDNTFRYHCNNEKNDFYNWVATGLNDTKAAKAIKSIKTRKGMLSKLKKL